MQLFGEELDIFIMYVENLVFELVKRLHIVDLLPDEVGGIVVDAQIRGGQNLENAAPDRRRGHQVLSARPLILAEEHGAVFDGDFDAQFLGQRDDRRPDFLDELQILLDGFRLIAADKRRNHVYAELVAGADHVFQVRDDGSALFQITVQRVGVVGEGRDFHLARLAVIEDVSGLFVAQVIRVDMAHARIAALRFALRPAGDFHAGKAHFACRIDHFLKRPAIQNGADKAQFHCVVPPSKCRRICRPFLYAGFIIACSRAKENREKRKCLIFDRT